MAMPVQMSLFEIDEARPKRLDNSSTFANNLSLPVHRWFRYSAGFSATWVREVLNEGKRSGRLTVLDPFSGSGTVLLEAEDCGFESIGVESHPFVSRIAEAKLLWRENPALFLDFALEVLSNAVSRPKTYDAPPPLISKCFPAPVLVELEALREALEERDDGSSFAKLSWLALVSVIRSCSPVGTAQWQYVLPNKSKATSAIPYEAYENKVRLMVHDMRQRQRGVKGPYAVHLVEDAREMASVPDEWADLIITSPPYANNYDYADATRLEMTFMREIESWGDLQNSVRRHLIRSCTQHVARIADQTSLILQDSLLTPIREEISEVCARMEIEKENHGGKKPYHAMIANYFLDLARVWKRLRAVAKDGSRICFVVGDSAPYGIHAPVDVWLGRLALSVGFRSYHFEKTRDRNTKWKNRKHNVPLHEGRLWVQG